VVVRDKLEKTGRDSHFHLTRDHIEKLDRDHHLTIGGKEAIAITGSHSLKVTGDVIEEFSGNHSSQVTQNLYLKGMQVVIEASMGLTIKAGASFITIDPSGIAISGQPIVQINSGGSALSGSPGSLVSPLTPTDATEASDADPGQTTSVSGQGGTPASMSLTDIPPAKPGKQSPASDAPTHDPNSPENKTKKNWIEIKLVDDAGKPVAGEPYRVTLPDGATVADGTLDEKGSARVEGIDPGNCQVTFPSRDKQAWKPK
jgi:type VI secretion system secreted protein VgrG